MSTEEEFRAALDRRDERLAKQLDLIVDRMWSRFDKMEARFDLRQDELAHDTQREFNETRRDLGELRDLVGAHGRRLDDMETHRDDGLRAAAEGGATGGGKVARDTVASVVKATAKSFWATWIGKLVAGAVGFTALVTGAGAMPSAARGVEKLWRFLVATK